VPIGIGERLIRYRDLGRVLGMQHAALKLRLEFADLVEEIGLLGLELVEERAGRRGAPP
jgi:hypothetical protein